MVWVFGTFTGSPLSEKEEGSVKREQTRALSALSVLVMLFFALLYCPRASAADIRCLTCHGKLTKGKSVHKAMNMGCPTCHAGIDARTVPHRKTNASAKGLTAEQPDLCYGCHAQEAFTRQDVHPAIGMGCLVCHNPHSSQNPRLLTAALPALCFSCHDKAPFTKKGVHAPVAAGGCMTCHTPHSSAEMGLLLKKPIDVCLQCHQDTPHGRHISSRRQHTDGQTEVKPEEAEPQDPTRPGKPFYCGSCHDPHSSDTPLLFRFNAQSVTALCRNCHPM